MKNIQWFENGDKFLMPDGRVGKVWCLGSMPSIMNWDEGIAVAFDDGHYETLDYEEGHIGWDADESQWVCQGKWGKTTNSRWVLGGVG